MTVAGAAFWTLPGICVSSNNGCLQSNRPQEVQFEWDPEKERANVRKHGVSFGLAITVFRDPGLLTIFDVEHSETEERWISMGRAANEALLVVVDTWTGATSVTVKVRIISVVKQPRPNAAAARKRYDRRKQT